LLRAEILRLRSRRFIRLLLLLGLVGIIAVGIAEFVSHARPDTSSVAAAKSEAAAQTQSCVDATKNDPNRPPNLTPEQLAQMCQVDYHFFFAKAPFVMAEDLPGMASALAAGMAALLFLVGTTSGGADWAAKTMPALLFWEPRRSRVLLTKLGVVVGLGVGVAVTAQLAWTVMALAISSLRGVNEGKPADFWSQLFWLDLRGLLLVVLAGAGGYALASVIRNTGAALGVAFAYLVVIENLVRGFILPMRPYLLGENVAALLTKNGIDVSTGERFVPGISNPQEIVIHLSNARSGLTLTAAVSLLVLIATASFRRRDLT
jgi:hypothetical protein